MARYKPEHIVGIFLRLPSGADIHPMMLHFPQGTPLIEMAKKLLALNYHPEPGEEETVSLMQQEQLPGKETKIKEQVLGKFQVAALRSDCPVEEH